MSVKCAVIYARSSTKEAKTASIANQTKRCQAWAKRSGYAVVGQYRETTQGNSSSLPVLDQATQSARTQQAIVICVNASRLGRQSNVVANRIVAMQQVGVTVIFVEANR